MSCPDCEHVQLFVRLGAQQSTAFIRISDGNVEVLACDKHALELITMLKRLQQLERLQSQ